MLLNRERARATMDKRGLDALVAVTPGNVYYLSDYGTEHSFHFAPWGLSCAILPRDETIQPQHHLVVFMIAALRRYVEKA